MKKLLLIPIMALAVLATPLNTAILNLEWKASPDTNTTGYKIYYFTNLVTLTPGTVLATVQGRLNTNTIVTVPTEVGFLMATAFSTNSMSGTNVTFAESDFSNPVYLKTLIPGSDFKVR